MQICTSLQTNNRASTPPLVFYRPDALPAAQPTASKHWRQAAVMTSIAENRFLALWHLIWQRSYYLHVQLRLCAFSALTLLVGCQEEHLACKNRVMRCCCDYLSGARCILFAYGPADATATPKPRHLLRHFNPDLSNLSGTVLPRLSWKRGR